MRTARRLSYHGGDAGPVAIRGDFGERLVEVASLAWDQEPFAVRLQPWEASPAPGVTFSARTIDLGGGRFTNSFELVVDAARTKVAVCSGFEGFFLPDLVGSGADGAVAAVSGSFSFISDEADYQPAEPCLDFCCRDGVVVSLPTAAKPAFLVQGGRPVLRDLDARGTVSIGGRVFGWIGSKVAAGDGDADRLVLYGAANCRVRYSLAPRTGFLREVERSSNISPRMSGVVDLVVGRRGDGYAVLGVRSGGGVDLFEGSYILRGPSALADGIRVGDEVRVGSVDDMDCADLESGTSVGPSLGAAERGETDGHDESLGVSPFQPGRRHARTVISMADGLLRLRVLDAAPLAQSFTGVSSAEAAELMVAEGIDPETAYHLDGGQSSKVAVLAEGSDEEPAVFGSMHYMLWPKTVEGPFLWRGTQGRRLRSAFRIGGV